jgi:hypothetical protein
MGVTHTCTVLVCLRQSQAGWTAADDCKLFGCVIAAAGH